LLPMAIASMRMTSVPDLAAGLRPRRCRNAG
jgi:hypothetical protein